jgi:glycosyltransferase involved in cell wall biosynthesis
LHIVADGISQVFECAALLLGIPIVASYHTDIIDLIKSHNGFFIQQAMVMYKEAGDTWVLDSAATTSLSFQRKLKRQFVPTEHIIRTAVDCTTFSPARRSQVLRRELMFGDEEGFLLVYAGRLSTEKRIDVLVQGLEIMRQQAKVNNRQIYLALVGDGPSAHKYAQLHGAERGIYCRPRFLDHWELGEVYASSDLHVSGSVFETLGNTVLEAFAGSIPVVVPNTQGFQDTVKHGEHGFLFPPGDVSAFVTYVTQLRRDDALRQQMGQRARQEMEINNQIEAVVHDLTRWYDQGIRRRSVRAPWQIVLSLVFLALNLPVSIVAFNVYDFLVNFLLKSFYVEGKKQH